jgi:hypothetical protein
MKKIIIKILKYLLIIGLGLILLLAVVLAIQSKNIKSYYTAMLNGKTSLERATTNLKAQNYSEIKNDAEAAVTYFGEAENSLTKIKENEVANLVYPIITSVNDLEYLTKTAEVLSKSLLRSSNILTEVERATSGRFKGSFSELSTADRQAILSIIYQSTPELNGLKANLQLSLDNLNKIHRIGILLPLNKQLSNIKDQLQFAKDTMDKLVPLAQLLPALTGYPQESNFLVILQNNDELRPTGGFIGTYGLMTVKDAKPNNITTEDVYHLDMPCIDKLKVTPPAPISKYMGVTYWWLRDANWSPDFPTSAQQIEKMFLAESECAGRNNAKPTAIIAINPDLISDLLKLVGPITVEGETYDSSNFQPLLQYNVEVAYQEKDITSWNRKNIINSVVSELEKRLINLPSNKWPDVLGVLQSNIAKRNLQIYFDNVSSQKIATELNITGETKQVNKDYLMIVDANLAAFKSDSVMEKKISYNVSSGADSLISRVTLDYKHNGGFDWRTTRYRSYTRIYAPLGSRLSSGSDLTDFAITDDQNLNKTIFGFFWSIEPGQSNSVSISYKLPKEITADNYELYFQKQSGSRLAEFSYTRNLENKKAYKWSGPLDRDQKFY